jgi:glycogen debranching enzyme
MPTAWNVGVEFGIGGIPTVTLIEGTSFVISSHGGDIEPGISEGLYYRDTRYLSQWQLRLDDQPLEPLAVVPNDPFAATFLSRAAPRDGRADSTLFVQRDRFVGDGMREDLIVRNLASEAAACTVTIEFDADFAHLFDVKEDRAVERGEEDIEVRDDAVVFSHTGRYRSRKMTLHLPEGTSAIPSLITADIVVPAKGEWRTCFEIELEMEEEPVVLRYRCGERVEYSTPARRLRRWERSAPHVLTDDDNVNRTLARSIPDLGSLRIYEPDDPEHAAIAAGAPWFMTLFGRDSIITSYMTLIIDPQLAVSTLRMLAKYQGTREDPRTEEEPGRILHEIRSGMTGVAQRGADSIYYGSVDATPLFVMLLGELHSWGVDPLVVDELLPAADEALQWIERYGDRDGDGFVEYQRATDRGLIHQGWKDSFDGINFANGRLADPPVALCEVQGYVYAAYLGRAHIARSRGDLVTADRYEARADELRRAFNERFFLEERGYYAVGLDAEKHPIDALTSNNGHVLWSGIADTDRAAEVAKHLGSAEMLSGWGVRTLGQSMGAYNPVSYHNGSVWPHDSAICAAGLMRYGFVEEAQSVALAVFEAAAAFDGRLPELMCGFSKDEFAAPVGYPTSCSPQAWASATPFSLLRTLLRLAPDVTEGCVWLAPAIPDSFGVVRVEQVPIGDDRVTIEAVGKKAEVNGLDPTLKMINEPRPNGD